MMKQAYKTKCFVDVRGSIPTFYEYEEWLEEIQIEQDIEIVSVNNLDSVLIVTYKEVGGNQ